MLGIAFSSSLRFNVAPQNTAGIRTVAVFVQMANPTFWPSMKQCIENIAKAGTAPHRLGFQIALHLALVDQNEVINMVLRSPKKKSLKIKEKFTQIWRDVQVFRHSNIFALTNIVTVNNTGADVGEFLQQVQSVDPTANYDLLLKVHSKTKREWRELMLKSLCGSASKVENIFSKFDEDAKLGMVGPRSLTWTYDTPANESFGGMAFSGFRDPIIETNFQRTWQKIYPNDIPTRDHYRIVAGTCFWSRYAPLVANKELRAAIPQLMVNLPHGHITGETCEEGDLTATEYEGCRDMYSLERVFPTIIKAKWNLEVLPESN